MDVLAYAKINLSLRVGARSDDGYHPVDSLIQTIDLADRITIEIDPGGAVVVSNSLAVSPAEDLAAIAARTLLAESGSSVGLRLRIDKLIPIGAGLGGGSSDAAAVLAAANALLDRPLPQPDLHRLAASLGADVALFLYGGALRVAGRGDIIRHRDSLREETFIVVVPRIHCNTAAVYRRFDELGVRQQEPPRLRIPLLAENDLESAALDLYPELAVVAAIVRSRGFAHGAAFVGMSGSGSAYYAAFQSADAATRVRQDILEHLPEARVFLTRPTSAGHKFEGGQR